jgi:hypothetical protein
MILVNLTSEASRKVTCKSLSMLSQLAGLHQLFINNEGGKERKERHGSFFRKNRYIGGKFLFHNASVASTHPCICAMDLLAHCSHCSSVAPDPSTQTPFLCRKKVSMCRPKGVLGYLCFSVSSNEHPHW